MSENTSRRAAVQIFFDGIDITDSIKNDLLSVQYTDNEEDEADDLQIKLVDSKKAWLKRWAAEALHTAASVALQQTNTTGSGVYRVTAKIGLNVRTGAGTGYYKIGALSYGATLTVRTFTADGWAEFSYRGKTAYASAAYLERLDDAPDAEAKAQTATGLHIRAVILQENWCADGSATVLDCGQFELDSIEPQGSPSTVTIKATALPFTSAVRQTKKTQAWENYRLSGIANEISRRNGMACLFESDDDPYFSRVEQWNSSDIDFLSKLCHDAGISLKVSNNILILFDQMMYEAKAANLTVHEGDGSYIKYKLKSGKAATAYSSCRVSYTAPSGKSVEATAYAEDYKEGKESNQQLVITAKVSSISEAQNLASKMLRLHNKFECTASFSFPGNTALCAGVNVSLSGFGYWDGKYIIKQARHNVSGSSGYTTQVDLRRVLEGY